MTKLKKGLAALLVAIAAFTGMADTALDPQPAYDSPDEARLAALKDGKMLFVMLGFETCPYLNQLRSYLVSLGTSFTDDFVYCFVRDDNAYGLDDETYTGSPYWGVFDPRVYKLEKRWAEDNGRLTLCPGWAGESGTGWYLDQARNQWENLNAAPTTIMINAPSVIQQATDVSATLAFPDGTRTDVTKAAGFFVTGSAATLSGARLVPVQGATGEVTLRVQGMFWGTMYLSTKRIRVEPPSYTIRFHRNDASDEKVASYTFGHGVDTSLTTLAKLNWARRGYDFKGWATSKANADAGKVWKKDGAIVATPVGIGKTLDVYAVWSVKSDSYAIQFIRNDGAGTWRTVGFKYGEKTRLPSLANGLGWARRGYDFKGWALTTADASAGKIWKADWSYVSTAAAKGKTLTVYAVWALKPGYYQIRFNKNDGTGKWRSLGYAVGVSTKLSTIAGLGWTRAGYTFKGWATSKSDADTKRVWKTDGATVSNVAADGQTLSIYAIWQ